MSGWLLEVCLDPFIKVEQTDGARSTRHQIEQQCDDIRSTGLRCDGIGPRYDVPGLRMGHFERDELAWFKGDGLRFAQEQIKLTYVVREILDRLDLCGKRFDRHGGKILTGC